MGVASQILNIDKVDTWNNGDVYDLMRFRMGDVLPEFGFSR